MSNANLPGDDVHGADTKEAVEFKRRFFWAAFKALDFNGIDGDYVEFGCHGGRTFRLAYAEIQRRQLPRHLWAFDSFAGLPALVDETDRHPRWQPGAMATDVSHFHAICASEGIPRSAYTVVEGFFGEVLPTRPPEFGPDNIALAYIDCDLHSSTRVVLQYLVPRLKHGMIVAFDDYFCWSSTQMAGERRAFLEVLAGLSNWRFVRYRDFGWAGASFLVEKAFVALKGVQSSG